MKKKSNKKQKNNKWIELIPFFRFFFPKEISKEKIQESVTHYVFSILVLAVLYYILFPFPISYYAERHSPEDKVYYYKGIFKSNAKILPEEYIARTPEAIEINQIWIEKLQTLFMFYVLILGFPILTQKIMLMKRR